MDQSCKKICGIKSLCCLSVGPVDDMSFQLSDRKHRKVGTSLLKDANEDDHIVVLIDSTKARWFRWMWENMVKSNVGPSALYF